MMNKLTANMMKADINFERFPKEVMEYAEKNCTKYTQYCEWLCICQYELVVRKFAYKKRTKDPEVLITEVERKSPVVPYVCRRNCYFAAMAGWTVIYKPENRYTYYYGYRYSFISGDDFDRWDIADNPMNVTCKILNPEYVFEIDKYKYCGYSGCDEIVKYLRAYEQDPKVEYFGKLKIPYSPMLAKKCEKDKQFANFIFKNASRVSLYGPRITVYAYKYHVDFSQAEDALDEIKNINDNTKALPDDIKYKYSRRALRDYIREHCMSQFEYADYLRACIELGLDMDDTKNLYPKDFSRMHDLRIDQRDSKRCMVKAKEFRAAAELWSGIENDKYVIVIPQEPKDLKYEGRILHHCVGKMGYDKKMAEKRCVIGFLRLKTDPYKPYVTVEYLMSSHQISQCYGEHDSTPPKEVKAFADEWGKHITKLIKGREKECKKVKSTVA